MSKRLMTLVLAALFIFPSAVSFAEENTTYSLSLADAIEMASEYSPDLECWDVNKQNLKVQYDSAVRSKIENKKTPVNVNQNYELIFVKNGYYVEAAKSQLELADIEHDKIKNKIAYDVTQKYYTVKNASKMFDIAQSASQRATDNLSVTRQKYEMGACTKLEVDNADIALMQCEANVQKAKNAYSLALDSLKIVLGIEGERIINLTDDITAGEFSADLDADTKQALLTRHDVNALKISASLAADYFSTASNLSKKSTTYFSAYTNSITAKYQFNTGVKNIGLLIKSAYFSAAEAQNDTRIAKQKLDYAKSTYEVNKVRYEMGMITGTVLSSISDELTAAENAYENALLTQKLAAEKYNYEIFTGI